MNQALDLILLQETIYGTSLEKLNMTGALLLKLLSLNRWKRKYSNTAKCSIDSLLDRTAKHMLILQSVTKYADKLKITDEPKMIGNESGAILKDNISGKSGSTWAYEVAGQTMVCPILVKDVNPPGQMLVEMLCEERGFFLEIVNIIRGFGLTILKGLMEIRDGKIWARFMVEVVPDGKWFCASYRCGIYGKSEFSCNTEICTLDDILYCDQCEREYLS